MISQHTVRPNKGSRTKTWSLGRGDGSGHGSYSGRGGKGQTARSGGGVKPGFEGGQTPLIRRLPKLRGFRNPTRKEYQPVNIDSLNVFDDGATIDVVALFEKKIVNRNNKPVKLLGAGELTKKVTVKVDAVSASAKEKVEAKGGTIVLPKAAE